ncbi:MAG: hypothetical protein ACPG19_06965 [Saprospiraceae bacterium]
METAAAEKVLQLPCPSCGGKLRYSAEKEKIACQYCGYTEEIDKANDLIIEKPLDKGLSEAEFFEPEGEGKKVFDCDNCGSKFMIETTDVDITCTFCNSHNVNIEAFEHQFIQPTGIVPFKISQKEGFELFNKWIRQGFFHPRKLKTMAKIENLHGIYLPFFTYDANAVANWSGEAGYHYTETQSYTDSEGNRQTRTVTRTRWKPRSGTFRHFFDDVLVVASNGLSQDEIENVYPFTLQNAVNYDPKLMLGWEAEVYSKTLREGAGVSENIMDASLRSMASHKLGGDTQRRLRVVSQKSDKTYKHLILPVWLATYIYKEKIYHFIINGQTGKVGGKKPYSWIKITLTVILAIIVIGGLYLLSESKSF